MGFDFDWNIFWRLHFKLNYYRAFSYRPYQKYYFEYTYKGVPQPTAEWHSNGTGNFFTFGLGMQLFGFKAEKAARQKARRPN